MGDSSSESENEEFSGIKQPTLLQQIKTILDEYRNDVQIIKELVQNADDAEATDMGILYERTTNDSIAGLDYGKFFQTPRLIFYNNAKFTDDDWEGIKAIYSSVKKDNPFKIGRFGLGFKSVFHMTDNPCIISGEHALFIDPLEEDPNKVCVTMKISKWNKKKYRGYFNTLKDTFGFSEDTITKGGYNGTIFLFPLRQQASKLSDDVYGEKEVVSLLQAFIDESKRSLLFLNTLCCVNIYVNLPLEDGVSPAKRRKLEGKKKNKGESIPFLESMNFGKHKTCYSVEVKNKSNNLKQKRIEYLQQLKKNGLKVPNKSMLWTHDVIVQTKMRNENKGYEMARWLIITYLKGGDVSGRTKELMMDDDLKYLHIVGLATPILQNGDYRNDNGHIFCYQPLPEDSSSVTKLPVHLNAFFALSQNRRQVRWPDKHDNTRGQGDKKIEWNLKLATEMFPQAYFELINELVEVSKKEGNAEYLVNAVYNSYPNLEEVEMQWKEMAEKFVLSSKDHTFLYTSTGGGKWIKIQDAVFVDLKKLPNIASCRKTLQDLLLADNVQLVKPQEHLMKSLESKGFELTYVTPAFVRSHLKHHKSYTSLTFDEKQDILHFILLDIQDDSLKNMHLLPLADGSFESFSTEKSIFYEEQNIIDLFPGKETEFVSTKVRPEIRELLSKLHSTKKVSCTQNLTADALVMLLKHVTGNKKVIMEPLSCKDKWWPWVRDIWNLIQSPRFKSKLKMFSDLPIFPVLIDHDFVEEKRMCLLPLKSSLLYMPTLKELDDRDDIVKCMQYLDINVTADLPEWLNHNLVREYLPEDNDQGMLSLFSGIGNPQINNFNEKSSHKDAAMLLKFISDRIHSDVTKGMAVLQKLKLFRVHTSKEDWELVSIQDCNKLYEGKMTPVSFQERLIRIESKTEVLFAKRLHIESVSETYVIINILKHIKQYDIIKVQLLMDWIIKDQDLFHQNNVIQLMRNIEFLKASDGKVYKPSSLFDPHDKQLIDLFRGQSVFPILDAQDSRYFERLQELGLKSRDKLTDQDIEQICSNIEERFLEKNDIDEKQCRALLEAMEEKSVVLKPDIVLNKCCILVDEITDENYPSRIPLKNRASRTLCSPANLKSKEYMYLAGSTMFMLDCKSLQGVSKLFRWHREPTIDKVVEHLYNIVCHFNLDIKSNCLSMITKVYDWLAEQGNTEVIKKTMEKQFASNQKYVWFGNGFKTPSHIYVEDTDVDIDLEPLLYKLPSELHNLRHFFIGIGCQKSLYFDIYIDTLHRIRDESENQQLNIPPIKLRKLAVAILNKINDDFKDELRRSKKELFFPVKCEQDLTMRPTKQCTFCDEKWLNDFEIGTEEDIFYVHPDVPAITAESLGVPSLRQQMLSNAEAFEEWGQEEPLTRRLRNLLEDGYLEGSIAKELFQNADDAGATKLFILLDERENNDFKTQLISDGMAECQGPAVWVYNDAKFNEDDFKNITKLSGGTKGNDSTKIGKFGLGFCSVYNLTDVPSFVSGNNVVIFDPHTSYLGKALSGKSPGLKINFNVLKNQNMMKKMKNQFKPFANVFGCAMLNDVAPCIDGTLFRLPLRNKGSEISDAVYTQSRVKKLFNNVMVAAANMLLFSQNVTSVKLFHLQKSGKNPSEMTPLYQALKNTKQMMSSTGLTGSFLGEASIRKQKSQLDENNSIWSVEKVTIEVEKYAVFNLEKERLDESKTEAICHWFVSWTTGKDKKMLEKSYTDKGAINLGAVAVPVILNDKACNQICRFTDLPPVFYDMPHLFFFLPLPIPHNFPFHINGQFAVSACRQQLHISAEDDTSRAKRSWNENILQDPVTLALLNLLECLKKSENHILRQKFFDLWPRNEHDPMLQHLQHSFYRLVTLPGVHNVFERDGQWFDISRSIFLDIEFRKTEIGELAFEVLSSQEKFLIDLPDDIYISLFEANENLIKERTVTEEKFFLEFFFKNLKNFRNIRDKRDKILQHSVMYADKNRKIRDWLVTNECIPSAPNDTFRKPCQLVHPGSSIAKLFWKSDGFFPNEHFSTGTILGPLDELGLLSKSLPNELVADRAQSIQNIKRGCIQCAVDRVDYLLQYLCENYQVHKDLYPTIKDIPFVPVKPKPDDWPFKWHSENEEQNEQALICDVHSLCYKTKRRIAFFGKASEVFYSECKDIVGCVALVFEENIGRVSDTETLKQLLSEIGMKGLSVEKLEMNIVISQLKTVATQNVVLPGVNEVVVAKIYRHLNGLCLLKGDTNEIQQQLKDFKSVYVRNTFTSPNCVAKRVERDCKPFLFCLQDSPLQSFPNLYESLGIVDSFEALDLAIFIQDLELENRNAPLNYAETNAVINILKCMVDYVGGDLESVIGEKVKVIYGPDENCLLRDCKTMCFNDFVDIEKSEDMIYAHNDMTTDLARRLGVKPKAVQNLENHSEDITDFYQDEPLVTRLKRLVEGYPLDIGIFKELLQNADDAGATEIVFLKDYDSHPTKNIADPKFKPLHGPALCVFNNSAFSNEDLTGIQRLGRGSKADDPSKTGRYGVGFNAVYNLTDAPSFFTKGGDIENGETMCFFDPLAKYIPNATKQRPGKRYKNIKSIRAHHSDMMEGYHETHFDSECLTVFRFPLRTVEMARSSEIKNEQVDIEMVSNLLGTFSEELGEIVLFLKNIKTVRIVSHKSGRYDDDYLIELHLDPDGELQKKEALDCYAKVCGNMMSEREQILRSEQISYIYDLTAFEQRNENTNEKRYTIVQSFGFKDNKTLPNSLRQAFLEGKIGLIPYGGVALYTGDNNHPYEFGGGKRCKAFCFLPLPIETNLPVHVQGYFSLDHESRRTLWNSNMPDMTCYRTLWNTTLIESVIAPAYVELLENVKEKMFDGITGISQPSWKVEFFLSKFQALFPSQAKGYYWEHLVCCVYRELIGNHIAFLPSPATFITGYSKNKNKITELSWTPFKVIGHRFTCYTMPESCSEEDNTKSDFNNILRRIGMKVVSVTESMNRAMHDSGIDIEHISSKILVDFLCSFHDSFPDKCRILTGVDVKETVLTSVRNASTLLQFCLEKKEYVFETLHKIPLMITQDNVVQTLPDNGKLYFLNESYDRFSNLFPGKLDLFLSGRIACLLISAYKGEMYKIRSLQNFGMREFGELVQETGIINLPERYFVWNYENPDTSWIVLFWDFFKFTFPLNTSFGKKEQMKAQLQLVRCLPLIPSIVQEQAYLVPYSDVKRIMDIDSFSSPLGEIFLKLGIQQIIGNLISKKDQSEILSLLKDVIPNSQCPNDVVECLHVNIDKLRGSCMNTIQARQILQYFNLYCADLSVCAINKMKDLPLFETHFGKTVSLSNYSEKIILDRDIPNEGLQKLSIRVTHLAFLRDTGMTQLFERLHVKNCTWVDLYERYIIPYQECFERKEFYKHVEFLSMHIVRNRTGFQHIRSLLEETKFIESINGKKVLTSELFDPFNKIFSLMCDASELVPECFRSTSDVMELFKLIGLHTNMTMSLFIRFARDIEGREHENSTVTKSKKLMQTLMQMEKSFFMGNCFDELSSIRFITPFVVDKKMSAIHKQFNETKLICFKGTILASSKDVSWTTMNILPEKADPKSKPFADEFIENLNICKSPSPDKLIEHCIKIGNTLSEKLNTLPSIDNSTVNSVMESIYKCLKELKENENLTTDTVVPLKSVPMIYSKQNRCIHVAKRIVNVCKDDEVIPPYLIKCPDEFALYHDLFSFLGANKEVTANVILNVLIDIASECGTSTPLMPKECFDCQKATCAFFRYLIQQDDGEKLRDDELYLLSKDKTLEPAHTMILVNNKHYEKQLTNMPSNRMKLLFPLEQLPISLKVEECVDSLHKLQEGQRPHLLTDLVTERVSLENIVYRDEQVADEIENFIHSHYFIKGFIRLARHVFRANSKKWDIDDENRLVSSLRKLSFKHTSGIKTNLFIACIKDAGNIGDEVIIEQTENSRTVHLEQSKTEGVCVYFDTSDQKWYQLLTRELTLYLNSIVCRVLKDESMMILMDMIGLKQTPEYINDFLSKEKIEEYNVEVEVKECPSYPVPGTFVPKDLHDYLDNDYGVIQDYEFKFIAFEIEDPALIEEDKDSEEIESDPTFIFVHIIRKLDNQDTLPLFQEYEINDGTESSQIVKAYQLFKFVRKKVEKGRKMVLYGGNERISSEHHDLSLKEARKEIRKILREAWSKDDMEKRKIIKRLLFRWHPDKNPNNVNLCTEVFQYIQQCLSRLEKGEQLIDDDDEDRSYSPGTSGSSGSSGRWSSWSGQYWGRHYRRWKSNARYRRHDYNDHNFWRTTGDADEKPYHWYSEARRWMRQAESDVMNAELSLQHAEQSFNWICYKAHQGAEKSLKAAWYAEDANKIRRIKYSHNLCSLASGLDSEISGIAMRLSAKAGDHSKMRYPDMYSGQQIPADAYTRETAEQVIELSREIICKVKRNHIK